MKKIFILLVFVLSIDSFALQLNSPAIKNNIIEKEYGMYGKDQFKGMPLRSIPFDWEDVPIGTEQFALVMEDFDAVEAVGVVWIHWITLIPGDVTSLKSNSSVKNNKLIQGYNSWWSKLGGLPLDKVQRYGGPVPPNGTHTYTITLYALDKKMDLSKGFYLNELYDAINGHTLEKSVLTGKYIKE